MKAILASSLLALGLFAAAPASAQSIQIGPDGPAVDMRSREGRELDRREMRRDMQRGEMRRDRREVPRTDNDDDDDED